MFSLSSARTVRLCSFAELRKRARHLENEIDSRLVALNKLGLNLGAQQNRFDAAFAHRYCIKIMFSASPGVSVLLTT